MLTFYRTPTQLLYSLSVGMNQRTTSFLRRLQYYFRDRALKIALLMRLNQYGPYLDYLGADPAISRPGAVFDDRFQRAHGPRPGRGGAGRWARGHRRQRAGEHRISCRDDRTADCFDRGPTRGLSGIISSL